MSDYQNGTQFEIWLARDDGTRLATLDLAGGFTYTWAINSEGFFSATLPIEFDRSLLAIGRRVYFWRKPVGGRLNIDFEGFVRRITTSTDSGGNTRRRIQGYGLNYLLSGRYAAYPEANTNIDTTVTPVAADDLLKAIVRTNAGSTATTANGRKASGVISSTYFGVAANLTLGPVLSQAFSYRNVLDVLREVCDASRKAGTELYFEIVPAIEDGTQHTMEFRTYIGQPGKDRTADGPGGGLTFGLGTGKGGGDFGNMAEAELIEDATDEVTRAYGLGQGEDAVQEIQTSEDVTRQAASIFALREGVAPAQMVDTAAAVLDLADAAVTAGRPQTRLTAKLLDVAGYRYGREWWRGDRVTIAYDGRFGDALVRAVTVSVDEMEDGTSKETLDCVVETYLT